jgi:hypothetical protein
MMARRMQHVGRGSTIPRRGRRRLRTSACFASLSLSFLFLAAPGCGSGPRYVPVSGTVRLNGEPYKDAVVTFQPMATATNSNPGRGSSAFTDASGRFELLNFDGGKGAVPGKHRIRIATKAGQIDIDPEKGSADNAAPARKSKVDPIPRSWNAESDKEFDVPPAGTDKADFDIKTK